jgi:hypothetical protein
MTFLMLQSGRISLVGFGIGFSVVLFGAIGVLWWKSQRQLVSVPHGR